MMTILIISVIFILSQVLAQTFKSFGIPSLITYVLIGIICGPSALNFIEPNEVIYIFSEIGILFLLYESGLEINLPSSVKTNLQGVSIALIGSFVPFFTALIIAKFLDYSQNESIFIAGSLVATSIGVTLKTFMELKKHHTTVAKLVLVAAVIDDIIGIVMLLLVSNFAQTKTLNFEIAFNVILFATILFLLIPVIKAILKYSIALSFDKDPIYVSSIVFFAMISYSYISYKLVHLNILGAFIIGYCMQTLNISKTKEVDNLLRKSKSQLNTLQNFFEPFFFVYIGLSFNLSQFNFTSIISFLVLLLIFLTVAILGKLVSGLFVNGFYNKLAIGVSMIPRAEVGLIFAAIGKSSGILNNELYGLIVLISLVTTLITPFALQLIEPKIS